METTVILFSFFSFTAPSAYRLQYVAIMSKKENLQAFAGKRDQRSSSGFPDITPDTQEQRQYNTNFIEAGERTLLASSLKELGCLFGFYGKIYLCYIGYCSST